MSTNGGLGRSELAAIRGGYLRTDAAAAFNALDSESQRRFAIPLYPVGPLGSYRTYTQQVYLWNLYVSGRGYLAARPGTSNHGWGLAVDVATAKMRGVIDRIGDRFGWSKRWSDAPGEWWHIKYRPGVWADSAISADRGGSSIAGEPAAALQRGSSGDEVAILQQALRAHGQTFVVVDGEFGSRTEEAVRAVQA